MGEPAILPGGAPVGEVWADRHLRVLDAPESGGGPSARTSFWGAVVAGAWVGRRSHVSM